MLETEIKKLNENLSNMIDLLGKLVLERMQQLPQGKLATGYDTFSISENVPVNESDQDDIIEETVEVIEEQEPIECEKHVNIPVTIDIVKKSLMSLASKINREAAKNLLKEFGANKLSDLKKSDYPTLIAQANSLVEE